MPRMIRVIGVLCLAAGCATSNLTLNPVPPTDRTVPDRIGRRFAAMMVLPPRGSERGEASDLAEVERVLLDAGIRVISSGITGRVIQDAAGDRVETAANLSDLERALILAKRSNAEALLQIIEAPWETDRARSFVQGENGFQEVTPGTPVNPLKLVRVREAVLRFQARLINVEDGEIVLNIDISQGTSRVVDRPTQIAVVSSPVQGALTKEVDTDTPDRRQVVADQVMRLLMARLTGAQK